MERRGGGGGPLLRDTRRGRGGAAASANCGNPITTTQRKRTLGHRALAPRGRGTTGQHLRNSSRGLKEVPKRATTARPAQIQTCNLRCQRAVSETPTDTTHFRYAPPKKNLLQESVGTGSPRQHPQPHGPPTLFMKKRAQQRALKKYFSIFSQRPSSSLSSTSIFALVIARAKSGRGAPL
jgi:hypothetical protein